MTIKDYDYYLVQFSGGKDCTAAFLHLLDLGVPKEKIELWHQLVDGKGESFMDWECTEDYCRKFAAAFKVPILFQWRQGGFEQEMLRENTASGKTYFEVPANEMRYDSVGYCNTAGGKGPKGTRLKFPQVSPNLSVRWCSSYLKKDVQQIALRNQKRFIGKRTLIITGERGEESSARAGYAYFEVDACDSRKSKKRPRHVDHLRPVKAWFEKDVWSIIKKYCVQVHPCYYIGYSRCSCKWCIFGNADQFATSNVISPAQGLKIEAYEKRFGLTIKRLTPVRELMDKGIPYSGLNAVMRKVATAKEYNLPIIVDKSNWSLPLGAYGKSLGPT